MKNLLFGIISLFSLVSSSYTLDAINDQITELPGLSDELAFSNFVKKFTFSGISCRYLLGLYFSLGRVWLL